MVINAMVRQPSVLKPGHNCWRIRDVRRAAFLVDGAAYFEALASAISKAQKTIYISAWDIDSRILLLRDKKHEKASAPLGKFLNEKAARTPDLHIFILSWDFAMIFAMEREILPIFSLGWRTHRRIHFHMDNEHPIGGSQHQKLVIVDDRVAFCGGLDPTKERWDTPEHRAHDPRRVEPGGKPYEPFHDVQMVVDGDAADSLSQLFRNRWLWATGQQLEPVDGAVDTPWPSGLRPDLTDIQVAVARTLPAYKNRNEIREVEALYLDAIAAAQRYIYVENQYFTSPVIADALAESLKQDSGPDIILILPKEIRGWLQQSAITPMQARLIKDLFKVDRHGRLRVYYPCSEDGKQSVFVHSKVMVLDDSFARVGSSNLNNRSMGLDSECDLAFEAAGNPDMARAIQTFRNRLLAEHLGTTPDMIEAEIKQIDSLIGAIEGLRKPGRTLKKLPPPHVSIDMTAMVPDATILDPEKPVELDQALDEFVYEKQDLPGKNWHLKTAGILLVLLGLAASWHWTPLSEWVTVVQLTEWSHSIRGNPFFLPGFFGAYIVGGLLMVPVTLLVGTTALLFSPIYAFLYALTGCFLSSLVTYSVGFRLAKSTVRRLAGRKLNRLSKNLARRGIVAVVVVRNLPIAPFTVVNMVAGASHVRLKDYLVGTALGMAPGIAAITVFANRLVWAIREPGWNNVGVAVAIATMLIMGSWWIQKRLSGARREERR
jgi:phosphatidylserine/phosphatidylglycerophosphate/cardiolipin synthase-like enzyme/uncharacterized membrane protein YdjX (TVP38/TMEM64 family)